MKETVHVTVATTSVSKVKSLFAVNQLVREKRAADLLRFRTCCCDPRASK